MSNQASNIQYIPPKCTNCGRQIPFFDSMCVSCTNGSIKNKVCHPSAIVIGKFLDPSREIMTCIDRDLPLMTKLYLHPASGVDVNQQLLETLKLCLDSLSILTYGSKCDPHYSIVIIKARAAIVAAEAAKKDGAA